MALFIIRRQVVEEPRAQTCGGQRAPLNSRERTAAGALFAAAHLTLVVSDDFSSPANRAASVPSVGAAATASVAAARHGESWSASDPAIAGKASGAPPENLPVETSAPVAGAELVAMLAPLRLLTSVVAADDGGGPQEGVALHWFRITRMSRESMPPSSEAAAESFTFPSWTRNVTVSFVLLRRCTTASSLHHAHREAKGRG